MTNPAILYAPETEPKTWMKKLPLGFEISYAFGSLDFSWRKSQPDPMHWKRPDKRFRFAFPWYVSTFAMEYLLADGTWVRQRNDDPNWFEARVENNPRAWKREVPISPTVNGDQQDAVMSVYVERWVSCPRIFRKMKQPWFSRVSRPSLKLEFSREMGRRAGSWKGGTVGTSTPVMNGESYEKAILRYVLSRPFDYPRPTLADVK